MIAEEVDFKDILTEQFNSDEKCGITCVDSHDAIITLEEMMQRSKDDPYFEARSIFSDGSSATCCTNYARYVASCYVGRTKICGFANSDNPDSQIAREQIHPCGHDFAIIDEQYLVDPWILLVADESSQIVFDLLDVADREKVLYIYGKNTHWEVMVAFDSVESCSPYS